MAFDGGYYLIKEPLIRGGIHQHTSANPDSVSDEMIRAVNIVQAVPWRINGWILDLMRETWVSGGNLGALPQAEDFPIPPRLPDSQWNRMDRKERAQHKYELTKLYERNAKLQGKREAFLRKLDIAETLRDEPAIYFPHFIDFRGRLYPLPQDLTPQGDDISKGLLMFAEGKSLTKGGLYWLAIRLANTYGQDKLTFEERIKWVVDNEELIFDSARNPLDGSRFWSQADEPWSFLATAREWFLAHEMDKPEEFVSHLPIPQDGTCNGLQHLSLMGRDPVGAEATNCSLTDKRFDLYSEVADVVKRMVTHDAVAGVPEAHHWIEKGIDRKVVKRAVMTTPYGVTERGIRDQLVADGHTDDFNAARYMQEKIVAALAETVVAAKEIMTYFQGVAEALAEHDIPLSWRTPAGMEVTQSYWNLSRKLVRTLQGDFIMWDEDAEVGLNKRKQVLASAPNIVHSFDAAMLAKTVISAHDNHDIRSFALVHDSYATYAADTSTLADVLREEAFKMYQTDRLAEFEDYVRAKAPGIELPPRPKLGTFDVAQVLQAPYFFA
jgi:DNA-directed RNA polymerase